MIKKVFQNLFSQPSTRIFPREVRTPALEVRGSVAFTEENCTFCSACALKCPTNAITVDRKAQTLDFDLFRCIGCDCCAEACKKGCVQMVGAYRGPVGEKPTLHFEAAPIEDLRGAQSEATDDLTAPKKAPRAPRSGPKTVDDAGVAKVPATEPSVAGVSAEPAAAPSGSSVS